jgi:hypothetical protein
MMTTLGNASRLKSSEVNTSTSEAADSKLSFHRFSSAFEEQGQASMRTSILWGEETEYNS